MMRLLLWIIAKIPLGKFAPYVLGLALGCWPQKIDEDEEDESEYFRIKKQWEEIKRDGKREETE